MNKQIERVKHASRHEFENKYLKSATPLIISSGLNWKAFKWTPEFFKNLFPNKVVDLEANYSISLEDQINIKNKYFKKTSMKNAIDLIIGNKNPNIKYYLSQKSIYKEFPELVADFEKPIWNDGNVEYDTHALNLWCGEAGNATPLHFDAPHNFLVQIYGRKHIRMFAPNDTKYLYPHTAETNGPAHLSQILDIDNFDGKKYPQFKYAVAYEGILGPGEALFIPAGWWHDVRSMDHAISINFWWRPKIQECPFTQILPLSPHEFYKIGKFNDIYQFFSGLNNFRNDLEAGKYFLNNPDFG